jgi:hypothetical protein
MRDVPIVAAYRRRCHIQRTQGGASLYPGLSLYAPLGRTIRLRIRVDCTMQAIQGLLGYSGWRLPMVLCPNGAQGDSPGQSEAPPWDSVRNKSR